MRMTVDAWAPEYGAGVDIGEPDELSVEKVDTGCEGREWAPIPAGERSALIGQKLAFVDGTRRIDARVFLSANGEYPVPGVAGSVGVGAVVCEVPEADRAPGTPATPARITDTRITRHLAVGDGRAERLTGGPGLEYISLPVPGQDLDVCVDAVHNEMRNREAVLAQELEAEGHLVFVDGPLAKLAPGPRRIVGYIKSHNRRYLGAEEEGILPELGCGERTPLFSFGEKRQRYSWYLRLCPPEEGMHGWHGVARCEVPWALSVDEVVALADASTAALPLFASRPYWDKRAPQNLVPVAGLEKRLRHLLGERELVYRMIRSAAMKVPV